MALYDTDFKRDHIVVQQSHFDGGYETLWTLNKEQASYFKLKVDIKQRWHYF